MINEEILENIIIEESLIEYEGEEAKSIINIIDNFPKPNKKMKALLNDIKEGNIYDN